MVSIVERALRQTQETRERQKLDRKLKTTNEELNHRLRDLTAILSTAKAVVSITDQRLLFDRILESALQLADAELGWLMLQDEKSKAYLLRAHRNLPEGWSKKMNQPVDDGISSLVALSGEALFMNGVALQKFKIAGLGKSAGVVPIKIKKEVIGLMIFVRSRDVEFPRDTQTLLSAMADYASISLVNARLFRALEQTAEGARVMEKQRYASLEQIRETIHTEVQSAEYPLNLVLTEKPGSLNPEQKKALEAVQTSLQRLARASEKTVTSSK